MKILNLFALAVIYTIIGGIIGGMYAALFNDNCYDDGSLQVVIIFWPVAMLAYVLIFTVYISDRITHKIVRKLKGE